MPQNKTTTFKRYFTLDEAAARLPMVKQLLSRAHREMGLLQDEMVLAKRLMMARQKNRLRTTEADMALLQEKAQRFEAAYHAWEERFEAEGIILRDLAIGLIDFPYHARSDDQDYLLCWKLQEDGIFYFHSPQDGFNGRYPITLLPD